jgi:hypothetical protein
VLCGQKAVEAGAVCMVLMVQGHLGDVTLAHVEIAAKTGLLESRPRSPSHQPVRAASRETAGRSSESARSSLTP